MDTTHDRAWPAASEGISLDHPQRPSDAPPGAYQVEIGLYLLSTGERLPVLNANGVPVDDRLLLPGLQVQAR